MEDMKGSRSDLFNLVCSNMLTRLVNGTFRYNNNEHSLATLPSLQQSQRSQNYQAYLAKDVSSTAHQFTVMNI